jgi:hypothetical protein
MAEPTLNVKGVSNTGVNQNAVVDALVYSEVLGVQPEAIAIDYDNFKAARTEYENTSMLQRVKQSWDIGQKNVELGRLGWRALNGENVYDEINRVKSSIPKELPEEYGLIEKAVRASAKLLPTSLSVLERSIGRGLVAGTGAAGIAAAAGQVGPQIAAPEEVITVPAAFTGMYAVGATHGAFEAAMEIEGGHGYLELLDMEV